MIERISRAPIYRRHRLARWERFTVTLTTHTHTYERTHARARAHTHTHTFFFSALPPPPPLPISFLSQKNISLFCGIILLPWLAVCAHNYSTWLGLHFTDRSVVITHASKHEHILTHAHSFYWHASLRSRSFKLDRSDWLEHSPKVNSAHLKCELCLLSQQISLSCSRRQRRHTSRAFCLKFGFFAFQFAINARVQWEEGRKKRRKRGRSSENNLIRTAMLPTAAPNEPGFAGITMLVTDT